MISEIGESKFVKQLIYSMWGGGKTIYVGSGGRKTLILRPPTDHTDSIISFYKPEERPREKVIHDWAQMTDAAEYLRLHGHEWDWVWLDSISLWQDTGLDDIWQAVIERRPDRDSLTQGKDKGEYGRNMDRLAEWVRTIVSMDTFNFGITAFPTTRLDAPGGERKLMPWVQGSMMSEKVCGYMNMVGYLEVKTSPSSGRRFRQISFNESEDYYAKDQYNAFKDGRLIDPTIPKMMEAVGKARGNTSTATPTGGKRKVVRKGAA